MKGLGKDRVKRKISNNGCNWVLPILHLRLCPFVGRSRMTSGSLTPHIQPRRRSLTHILSSYFRFPTMCLIFTLYLIRTSSLVSGEWCNPLFDQVIFKVIGYIPMLKIYSSQAFWYSWWLKSFSSGVSHTCESSFTTLSIPISHFFAFCLFSSFSYGCLPAPHKLPHTKASCL